MVIPAPEPAGSLTHKVSHELKSLEPGAVYEAIVQAKNRYGWNEVQHISLIHVVLIILVEINYECGVCTISWVS